jgi:hypothetical protein
MDYFRKYKSLFTSSSNSFSTGSDVDITLNSATGLPTDTEITLTFDRVDSAGTATDVMERIRGTVSGVTFTVAERGVDGTTERAHTSPVVEMIWNADDINDLVDGILVEHDQDGGHDAVTVTSLNGHSITTGSDVMTTNEAEQTLTNKTISTGSKLDANADPNFTNVSMSRQAIMNGNFDVWQRGTSFTMTAASATYGPDRWRDSTAVDGGTNPTLTRTRQVLTAGELPGSFFSNRLTTNGAGTSLGAGSYFISKQCIEHGVRNLCGLNKKVTLSFWAKSDIANKKIGINIRQVYGTGGSPTAAEEINGASWTLTSTLTKYTHTFTTNTLSGKTFGTAYDDFLEYQFWYAWGTTYKDKVGAAGAETYVGAGNIDIAQVQLCAGDVALPFQPKSFEEELRACQRYYEKSYNYDVVPGTSTELGAFVTYDPVAAGIFTVPFKVTKRAITPAMFSYSTTGAVGKYRDLSSGADFDATLGNLGQNSFKNGLATHGGAGEIIGFHWTAESEL